MKNKSGKEKVNRNVSVALLLHNCNKHVMIQSRVEKRRVKKIIYKNQEVENERKKRKICIFYRS